MIRREPIDTFTATAPISPAFRHFMSAEIDGLRPVDDDPDANLVILSNGKDVATAFRRTSGSGHVWQHVTEYLPSCQLDGAVSTASAMTAWMFAHYPVHGLCSVVPDGDRTFHAFSQAIGGRPVHWFQGETVYEILGRTH